MSKDNDFFKSQTESSRIKAKIVSEYFPKYSAIILKKGQRQIRYLDLFAGPGVYEDGNISTPILIAQACAKNPILAEKVLLMFNDNEHIETLKNCFYSYVSKDSFRYVPRFGSKTVGEDEKITEYLSRKFDSEKNPYPTLLFVDPFGYKGINTTVLCKFLLNWGNEIFLFLNIKRVHAAIENDKFDDLMRELFPTTINAIRNDRKYKATTTERIDLILDNLAQEYKNIIPEVHTLAFRFQEEDSRATSHFIIHFTKHHRGYDLVKQIYDDFDNVGAALGKNGDYTFDVKRLEVDTFSRFEFEDENIEALSQILLKQFNGKVITAKSLFDSYHSNTKYSRRHFTCALRSLVEKGYIKSKFTDDRFHEVTVLINEHCILDFS